MTMLSERTLLASLHTSVWGGRLHDATVTEEVNEQHKAEKDAASVSKQIVSRRFLKGITSAAGAARTVHRVLTLPWDDDGTRIMSTTGYTAYTDAMRGARQKFDGEVKQFSHVYNDAINEAANRLGTMFDRDEYPPLDDVMAKFGFDVEIKATPDAGDFRAKLSDATVKAITKDIEQRTDARIEAAMHDVFLRVHDVVAKMSDKLKEYKPAADGSKAESGFRDSLVWNIKELAEVMPTLNITDDKRITELSQKLLNELIEQPELLRDDSKLRAQHAAKADKILAKVKGYLA